MPSPKPSPSPCRSTTRARLSVEASFTGWLSGVCFDQLTSEISQQSQQRGTLGSGLQIRIPNFMEAKSFPRTPDPAKERARTRVRSLCQVCPGSAKCKGVGAHSEAGVFHLCFCGLLGATESCQTQLLCLLPKTGQRWEVAAGPIKNPDLEGCFRLKRHVGRNTGLVLSRWRPAKSQPVTENAGGHGPVCSLHRSDSFTG